MVDTDTNRINEAIMREEDRAFLRDREIFRVVSAHFVGLEFPSLALKRDDAPLLRACGYKP